MKKVHVFQAGGRDVIALYVNVEKVSCSSV